MLNVDSEEEELRSAAYDLLGAICSYLDYDKNPVITSKGKQCHPTHCAHAYRYVL